MDAKYLKEIKARTAQELTDDDYHKLKIADIAKIRMDSKRLVAEVERLTKDKEWWMETAKDNARLFDSAMQENATLKSASESQLQTINALANKIVTLKKALALACDDIDYSCGGSPTEQYDIYIHQTEEQEGKNG